MNPLLQRAKDEVARNYGFKRWDGMLVALRHTEIKLSEDCTDLRNKAQDEAMELYAKYRVEEETEKVKKLKKLAQDLYSVTGNNKPPISVFSVLQDYNKIMKEV